MVYDLILLGVLILCVVICYHIGAARAVAGIVISFVAYLAAAWLGGLLAEWFFNSIIAPSATKSVTDAVTQITAGSVAQATEPLPAWLISAMKLTGTDISAAVVDLPSQAANAVITQIRPLVVGFVSLLLTILLFFVLRFLLSHFVAKPVLALFELPVLSTVNKVLGAIFGVIDAFIIICIFASLLKLVLPYVESNLTILNESTIYNSFIFYHFYSGNIFTMLLGWIGLK